MFQLSKQILKLLKIFILFILYLQGNKRQVLSCFSTPEFV